jgi:Tfp pilus assembly protein PilN
MANINLYQVEQTEAQKNRAGIFDGGMLAAMGFALVVLLVFGGMKFYLNSLDQKMVSLNEEENAGRQALNEEDVNLVASFGQRIDEIKLGTEAFATNDPAKIFEEVQKTVLSGVVVSELSFKGNAVDLNIVAENFEILSKQILSFKNADLFKTVEVASTNRNESGKVAAILSLGL